MAEKTWKNYLLKSGLPFEYEVKECLIKHNCNVWDEYSYIRSDENNLDKEFSYDLDADLWSLKGNHCHNFMIECKYKTEPTNWVFLPDPYSHQQEVNSASFMHPLDYLINNQFLFTHPPYDKLKPPLGPCCLKGIELFKDSFVETNIYKAINQLSYAFADKLVACFENQLKFKHTASTLYFNIPIIITNAELYLLNEQVKTTDIQDSEEITDISTRHDFLMFHNKSSEALKRYNHGLLSDYFASIDKETFQQRNKSFSEDIDHLVNVIADHYCPQVILIMHHDKEHANYQKLFDYLSFFTEPSAELTEAIKKAREDADQKMRDFEARFPSKKKE